MPILTVQPHTPAPLHTHTHLRIEKATEWLHRGTHVGSMKTVRSHLEVKEDTA